MLGEGISLHPYDVLAHPKRRKLLEILCQGALTYSDLMKKAQIEDSGKLSYHLAVLSRYIQHERDLYCLSIEGKVLSSSVQEFEKKSYGLMGSVTGSGTINPEGIIKMAYSVRLSLMTSAGDAFEKNIGKGFDKAKADAAIQAAVDKLSLGISRISMDPAKDGLTLSFEHEAQAFVEKDGWMVAESALSMVTTRLGGEGKALPIPGLHMQIRGSILYPDGALVERDYPSQEDLEEKGVEVYELAASDRSQRWRVRKEAALCLGESRLQTEGDTTREIVDIEIHGVAEDPSQMAEVLGQMRALPGLVSGKTRFKLYQQHKNSNNRSNGKGNRNRNESNNWSKPCEDDREGC